LISLSLDIVSIKRVDNTKCQFFKADDETNGTEEDFNIDSRTLKKSQEGKELVLSFLDIMTYLT
jgi:hypothetical protein